MNHVIHRALTGLVLVIALSACAATGQPVATDSARIMMPRCLLERNVAGEACVVRVFDGMTVQVAQRDRDGRAFIDVSADSVTGPRVAVYQAPGYSAQVHALKMIAAATDTVDLKQRSDARGGILAGIVFKPEIEDMNKGICGIENFLAGREVIVHRGRARYTATTDSIGSFMLGLPAGDYTVRIAGEERDVVVPHNDTVFITLAVSGN